MTQSAILTVNAGSSSVKFSVYAAEKEPRELARGEVSAIGSDARISMRAGTASKTERAIDAPSHSAALAAILDSCRPVIGNMPVKAIGHRVVHGGAVHDRPVVVDESLMTQLKKLEPLAPLHQPHNLAGLRAAQSAFPAAVQVACFDTAFHRSQPWLSETFALPRHFHDKGVRRYGFHGLSYDFVASRLRDVAPEIAGGRVVIAHLGNGASMCAIREGKSMGSTMGFSPLDGLPMGTRCGQIDPGVLLYLMETEGMDAQTISDLLYKKSGLKGLSGLSNDMRELEASSDPQAEQAIDYFAFRIRREIGAMAAILGGLDGLVFTGGIGENSQAVRRRVCVGMDWLGIAVDDTANAANAPEIGAGPVRVMVIPTDEERVIARATAKALAI